jgi:CubicO group peptidase (beta-lactamase class C family)
LVAHRSPYRYDVGMKKLALLILAVALVMGCASVAERSADLETIDDVIASANRFWDKRVDRRHPGVVAAFVKSDGTVEIYAHGMADTETGSPMSAGTVFQVASLSKTVTGYGVLRLVDQELVSLDSPAENYIARFSLPASEWDSSQVTVRRLLSHTAGTSVGGYHGFPPAFELPSIEQSLAGLSSTESAPYSPDPVRIIHEPGTRHRYSGGGFTLLQLLVEEVSRQRFADYMADAVLAPLNMTSSTFDVATLDRSQLAVGHDRRGRPVPNYLFTAQAAAGLYATAGDLALLLQDLSRGIRMEPALLSNARYLEMTTAQMVLDDTVAIGLPFFLETMADGSTFAFHSGRNVGWDSLYGLNLDRNEGFVILTNTLRGHAALIRPVSDLYRRYVANSTSDG